MKMFGLFDEHDYETMRAEKYIRINQHPSLPLHIINYTEKAQFDNEWNNVTKQCRGLIVDDIGNVIARPFDKFLNYGQNQSDILLGDYAVEVTDKMDGSLGILWNYKGYQGIATRGSFVSDQAIHATKLWQQKYDFKVNENWTYLFEIIYPENRIVLDYKGMDDLVLLGVRDISDGSVLAPGDVVTWQGPKTTTFHFASLSEALAAPSRDNAEGFVVYFPELDYRIKVKQEDYVIAHRLISGLNDRSIWEALMSKGSIAEYICVIPDEFHEYVRETTNILLEQFQKVKQIWYDSYSLVLENLPAEFSRRDFAKLAIETSCSSAMFSILDDKDISEMAWKAIRPEAIINGVQRSA